MTYLFGFFLGTFSSNTLPQECIGSILSKSSHFQKSFPFIFTFSIISCFKSGVIILSDLYNYCSTMFGLLNCLFPFLPSPPSFLHSFLFFLLPSPLLSGLPFFSIFLFFPFLPYFLPESSEWFFSLSLEIPPRVWVMRSVSILAQHLGGPLSSGRFSIWWITSSLSPIQFHSNGISWIQQLDFLFVLSSFFLLHSGRLLSWCSKSRIWFSWVVYLVTWSL